MNLINDFRYRTEVDGLRAIAVISVILFHAGFGCPGGYVGVDVFFVISGFLITSLIWKDLEGGKFTFANFWERRARRIVPALVVVTLVTLIAGWFLLLPSAYASLGKAAASQAVFAANIHYWLDSGYFSGAAEEKPLLHTWSLAVEEQFYLIVPFILWSGFHFRGLLRCRGAILSLLIVGCVLSLAMSIYGVIYRPSEAFYLLPTRIENDESPKAPLDWSGLALLILFTILILVTLSDGQENGWTDSTTLYELFAAIILFFAFIAREYTTTWPLLNISLFKQEGFVAANIVTFIFGAGLYASLLTAPLFLQLVQGLDATSAGFGGVKVSAIARNGANCSKRTNTNTPTKAKGVDSYRFSISQTPV